MRGSQVGKFVGLKGRTQDVFLWSETVLMRELIVSLVLVSPLRQKKTGAGVGRIVFLLKSCVLCSSVTL